MTSTTTTTVAEREDLRAAIRGFLAARLPESTVRELIDTESGVDQRSWAQLASELGLAGLLVPEEYGGQGLSTVELDIAGPDAVAGGPSAAADAYLSARAMTIAAGTSPIVKNILAERVLGLPRG